MKNTIMILALSILVYSCNNQTQKKEVIDTSKQKSETKAEQSKIGQTNYAVIWKWTTTSSELVAENSSTISNELTELWKKNLVENAYYDNENKGDKLDYFPNIAFFLKAPSKIKAQAILDELTVVKKGIASYQLHPVGHLWLKRNLDEINKRGLTNSFAVVWTTKTDKSPTDEIVKSQNDIIIDWWNQGKIENVYFDIEGTQKDNENTDFVFFVNANTKEKAEALCNSLPFYKEGFASYKIYQAGVFWLGEYNNQ